MTVWSRIAAALGRRGSRRQMAGAVVAGLFLGLGSVTIATSLAQATERGNIFSFLEDLFRGPAPPAARPARPARYVNLPDRHRVAAQRPVLQTPRPGLVESGSVRRRPRSDPRAAASSAAPSAAGWSDVRAGLRTVCVRLCDGYLFPIGNLRGRTDLPVHQAACAAACPGARTSLYTLASATAELDEAVSLQGAAYKGSALANVYRQRRVADCSCQPAGGIAHLPIGQDMTLVQNDAVATRDSARVLTRDRGGAYVLEDYRSARLPRGLGRQIEGRVGAIGRAERARAFRLALRREERAAQVRVAAAGSGFRIPGRASAGIPGPRVVVPSPYTR